MLARRTAPRFGDRDSDIVYHIVRYRMSTRDVLHRLFFSDSEPNAATKVTSRLVKYRFLNRYELPGGKSYFGIGPNAARMYGYSQKKCTMLGPQALLENYAILQFCCAGVQMRERLLVSELQAQVGNISGKHLNAASFYIDSDGVATKLACMRVDHGGPAAHVVRKCRAELESLIANEAIADFVKRQKFLMAIITVNNEKARAIKESIQRQTWPIQFRVEAVSDLATLIIKDPKDLLSPDGNEGSE